MKWFIVVIMEKGCPDAFIYEPYKVNAENATDAIDYVRKRWNSKNADKINSWQIDYTDQDIIKVLMDKSRLSQL